MLDQFSATIEMLYAAAADPTLWGDALAAVEELTDCAGAVVNVIAKGDLAGSFLLNGPRISNHCSPTEVEEYNRELLPYCPRVAAGITNPDLQLVCDYMLLSEAEMDRNIAYEWYGRHGLRCSSAPPSVRQTNISSCGAYNERLHKGMRRKLTYISLSC